MNSIVSDLLLPLLPRVLASIGIGVEPGKVARGNRDTNAMPLVEYDRCAPEIDINRINLARLHELRLAK